LSKGIHRRIVSFAAVALAILASDARAQTGGFVDSATSGGVRPRFSSATIQSFLPSRGRFTFPSPYSTEGVRLTNASDCGGGDCVLSVGYSYWRNINNHAGSDTMLIFLGLDRRKGGGGPTLFSYNKRTGETQNRGPLFDANSPYASVTGEGWYFSATQPNVLYVSASTTHLDRYDVITHALGTVFDVASRPDLFGSNRYIWQIHSSNDDRVHSATLKDASSYADLGCLAYREDTKQFFYFPQKGLRYDECQIDKTGRWLVIKEKTGLDSRSEVDNRIIDLQTGNERVLLDRNGAGGHSDNGLGYMVASDNFNPQPGAVRVWRFDLDVTGGEPVASVPDQGTLVYQTTSWDIDIGHVSHANSQPNVPLDRQYACGGNASRKDLPRANEIVCFRLDGSLNTLIVAPNITDLDAPGGGSEDYWKLPKGNLDVTGEYFIWAANAGTNRLDAYIVRIPKEKLGAGSSTNNPPPTNPPPTNPPPTNPPPANPPPTNPPPATPPAGQPIVWINLVNVTASGSTLRKTAGCGGCPDAGAISQQQISATGFVQFTMSETDTLRYIGLTSGSSGTDAGDIRYALRLQAGRAEVRESGAYRSEIAVASGDTLRIAVTGGTVEYSKNGAVFFSSAASGSPLIVKTSFYDLGATLTNVTVGSATSATNSSSTSTATATSRSSTSSRSGALSTAAKRSAAKKGGG
jgi:hypothetical protein